MALSIKTKVVIPVGILAVMMSILIVAAWYALKETDRITNNLAERFSEIEEVRDIESLVTKLLVPHVEYITHYSERDKTTIGIHFQQLDQKLKDLNKMEAVNAEERELLEYVTEEVAAIKQLSAELLAMGSEHHHHAMSKLDDISEKHISALSIRLHEYHAGEMQQVNGLVTDSGQQLKEFSNWVVMFSLAAVVIVVVSFWVNNSVLIRPIVSLSRTTTRFATGDLKQKVPVYSQDELGNLAANINRMAESLDGLYAQMSNLAKTDQLTGLINRHGYEEIMAREMSSAKRYAQPLSLAILDIDHFKKINDTYGHMVGDKVLKAVAETSLSVLRDCDYCFRFGGEEFIVLMPQTADDAAMAALERLRKAIEENVFQFEGHAISLTVSAGVASFAKGDETQEQLLNNADQALYTAKEGGRNRVVSYASPTQA